MNPSSTIGSADLRVREALRFVAANILQTVLASTLGAGVLVFLLRHSINLWSALPWLTALIAVAVMRLRLRALVAHSADAAVQRERLQQLMACALASGIIWAVAPWALSSGGDARLQSILLLSCVAIGTGGAFASLASLRI